MINQYWPRNRRGKPTPDSVSKCKRIITILCPALDVRLPDIMGQSRKVEIVVKRWIIWNACIKSTSITANELGNMFGRTRGAVEHGMRALADELDQSARARAWNSLAASTLPKFNWSGNRPKVGKRSMCGVCGMVIHAEPCAQCPGCGEVGTMTDVGFDDK